MGRNQGAGRGGSGALGPRPGRRFVPASSLFGASQIGPVTDRTRLEKVRQALRAGKNLGPVKITVGANGRMFIDDGRHRIAVLREPEFRGRQVEVIFRRGRVRD